MEFKERLKTARQHAKLNQTELAERAGLTQTSISDLERGKSKATAFAAQIASACGVSPMWLAEGVGDMLKGLSDAVPLNRTTAPGFVSSRKPCVTTTCSSTTPSAWW